MTELKYIATGLVEGKTCDTLLSLAKLKLNFKDSIISEKDLEIANLNEISVYKDDIINVKESEIQVLNQMLTHEVKKHKWTKYGWAATATILGTIILLLSLH